MLTCHHSFENRDACEEVIKTFNNHTIKTDAEELQVQIRYADTQEQKSLKQQTQAARQFRSAEYEYATQAWRQGRLPYAGTTLNDNASTNTASTNGNEFEQYLGTSAAVPFQNQRWAQLPLRQAPGRSPLGGLPFNNNNQANSQTSTAPTKGSSVKDVQTAPVDDASAEVKTLSNSPVTAPVNSPVDSVAAPEQE